MINDTARSKTYATIIWFVKNFVCVVNLALLVSGAAGR